MRAAWTAFLVFAVTPVLWAVPTRYYCGGAVSYTASAWYQQSATGGAAGPQHLQLTSVPVGCPSASAGLSNSGGVGSNALPTSDPSDGVFDAAGSSYRSYLPPYAMDLAGVLGETLRLIFRGPGVSPSTATIDTVKAVSAQMVTALDKDSAYVATQIPALISQTNVDSNATVQSANGVELTSTTAATSSDAAIEQREPTEITYPTTALGNMLDLLKQKENQQQLQQAIGAASLRVGGTSIFGVLDGTRDSTYATDNPSLRAVELEGAKLTDASSAGDNANYDVARADLNTALEFTPSAMPDAAAVAAALVEMARSQRYIGSGLLSTGISAELGPDGITFQPSGTPAPPGSVELISYITQFDATETAGKIAGQTWQTTLTSDGLPHPQDFDDLAFAASLLQAGTLQFTNGHLELGTMGAVAGAGLDQLGADGTPRFVAPAPPDLAELAEFTNQLGDSTTSYIRDDVLEEFVTLSNGIAHAGAVSGLLFDFIDLNDALVTAIVSPSAQSNQDLAMKMTKFGFANTATLALAEIAAICEWPVILTAGATIATSMAVDYAVKALIADSYMVSHPPTNHPIIPQ